MPIDRVNEEGEVAHEHQNFENTSNAQNLTEGGDANASQYDGLDI